MAAPLNVATRKDLANKNQALPDGSFPIRNKTDLANAIKAFGLSKNKVAAKAWIVKRATELNATDMLPDGWAPATVQHSDDVDDFLAHHGVLGMHWGRHKAIAKAASTARLGNQGPTKHAVAKAIAFGSYGSKRRFKDPVALQQRKTAGRLRIVGILASVGSAAVSSIGGPEVSNGKLAAEAILNIGGAAAVVTGAVEAVKAINTEKDARAAK